MNCLFLRGFLSKTKSHCKIARQEVKLTKCQLKPWSRAEIQAIRKNFSKVKATCHVWLFVIPWTVAHQAPLSMGILQARILEWVATPSPQGFIPTQELNSGLPHCRQIFYRLSHQGSPRIQEWVTYLLQGIFLTQESNRTLLYQMGSFIWGTREAPQAISGR